MDRLRKIAKAHYKAGDEETQELARDFFEAMDADGNGEVDFGEFEDFMKEEGKDYFFDEELFDKLDKDRNESLDFWEVMTLYYIIKSGRPFCKNCESFLTGSYFACVECFESSKGPYVLCLDCYKDSDTNLNHRRCRSPIRFWDNYTMLEAHRISALEQRRSSSQRGQSSHSMHSPSQNSYSRTTSYSPSSMAIVPARGGGGSQKNSKLRMAYKAFEGVLKVGNFAVGVAACTIM